MSLDNDLLLELIGRFHDAALAPSGWPPALECLSDALGGVPVHFGVQRLPKGMPWMASVRRDPIYHRIFQERFAPPHRSWLVEATAAMRPGVLYQRHQFVGDADYRASEEYNAVIRPLGQDEIGQAVLLRAQDLVVPFTIYRRRGTGAFAEAEVAFLQRLLPHLSRSLQVHLRLEAAEAERRGLEATLDRVPLAVLLLDGQARLVWANAAADALLRSGDGLGVRDGRVVGSAARATERLQRLVAAAAATGTRCGDDPGGSMALPRRPPARPLSVLVAPLAEGAVRDRGLCAAAVMLVRDPDGRRPASTGHLAELYGLTAAEARTATALLAAEDLRDVAARLGIGLATVRTHLHRVFDKTGTSRQADLVRLLTAHATLEG